MHLVSRSVRRPFQSLALALALSSIAGLAPAFAAEPAPPTTQPAVSTTQPTPPTTQATETGPSAVLPPTVVSAQKRTEDVQKVPLSMSVVGGTTLRDAGVETVKDAGCYVPNLLMEEFTSRKLSFPFIRGVGSGPLNPSVTTYVDGVPQLNAYTSSTALLDVQRIEFLRGPQGTLYGRNTLGGLIQVVSRKPDNTLEASADAEAGNYEWQQYRVSASGPVVHDKLFFGISGLYDSRDGFTKNTITGHSLDDRESWAGRGELRFTPAEDWEIRLVMNGEHDHDGDYALGDLSAIRATPHRVAHDFEGSVERDLYSPSLTINHYGEQVDFSSVSAFGWWATLDVTDLDATPLDLIVRHNHEIQQQFTQEFRFASAKDHPLVLGDHAKLEWVGGVFVFTSDYKQQAFNALSAAASGPLGMAFLDENTAALTDVGVGAFGQGTLILWDKLDVTAGLRYDHEHKEARLAAFTSLPFLPSSTLDANRDFDEVSPRFALAYHVTPDLMPYASIARGYKAGGFNAEAPTGAASFDPEDTWTYEVGVKTQWLKHRLTVNADVFYLDWNNLQLDTPNPAIPGRFFIANSGDAVSKGVELEAHYQILKGWELFTGLGYADARFLSGSMASGMDVGGHRLPFASPLTFNAGTQASYALCSHVRIFGRAEVIGTGEYFYDASNAARQDDYFLTNFRLGLRGSAGKIGWRVEGWVRNAFDSHYVPLAFPFPGLAPSGYVGESGAPRTYGATVAIEY